MERFCGIKKTYDRLPDAALFRIYEICRRNCKDKSPEVQRIDRLKALLQGLNDARSGPSHQARFSNRLLPEGCSEPMVFLVHKDAAGKVDRFLVSWYRCYKPRRDQIEDLWMSLEFHARTNVAHLYISEYLESHQNPMKKTWKFIMSATVAILDRYFKTVNPQTIQMHVRLCTGRNYLDPYASDILSTVRLVDAVRAASKGKVLY